MQRMPMQPPPYGPPGSSNRGPAPPYFRAPGPPGMPPYHPGAMNAPPHLRPNGTPPMMPPNSMGPGTACPPPYPFPGPSGHAVHSPSYSAGYAPPPLSMPGIQSSGGPGFPPPLHNQPIDSMSPFPMGPGQMASPRFPGPPDGGLPPMMNAQYHGGGPPMGPPMHLPPGDMYNWPGLGFPQPLTNLDARVPSQKVQYFAQNGQMPPPCAPSI
ncbi:hypothetical protein L596_006325 [Steinernema carpocapsae]|uniref:Uncharacterized protein n=1 Tax=Steinernema carpocapsae TaxID=34508 RepID=A0A4U8V1Z1_STECR|nr:hypothetical protein L596_006325 [Steinernema carpocapsae]